MFPELNEDDFIFYKPIKQSIKLTRGDIVVANDPIRLNKLIVKRIYKIHKDKIDLRGDNYKESTDSRQFGLLNTNNIIGLVTSKLTNKPYRD